MAVEAKTIKNVCTIITLDVKNASNAAKWKVILNTIKHKGVNENMFKIKD